MAKRKRVGEVMLLVAGEEVRSDSSTYIIEGVVGRGGFGAVYSATVPEQPGRRAALKEFFSPSHPRDQAALKEIYEREKFVGAQASPHPLMPTFYEAFKADGHMYIAQEYIEGTTLDEIIANRHPIPKEWILKWAVSLCDALAFLHLKQIVHHDLKPPNIRITPLGHLTLLDFGAAQYFGKGHEKPLELYGTEGYLPPELDNDGAWVADVRTDIFALGCILYEMIAGEPPDQKQINQRSVYVTNSLIHRPNADLNLVSLINKALSFNTEYRYQGAAEFLVEIRKTAPPVLLMDIKHLRFGTVVPSQMITPKSITPFNAGGGDLRLEVKPRAPWIAVSKAKTDQDNKEILVHIDITKIPQFNKVVTGRVEICSPDTLDENGKVISQGDRWFVDCSIKLVPRQGNLVLMDQIAPNASPIFVVGKSGLPAGGTFELKNVGEAPVDINIGCDLTSAPPFIAEKLKALVVTPAQATMAPGSSLQVGLNFPRAEAAIGEYRNTLLVKTSENQTIPVPLTVQLVGKSGPLLKTGIIGASYTGIVLGAPEAPKVDPSASVSMQELSKLSAHTETGGETEATESEELFPVMRSEPDLDKGTVFSGYHEEETAVKKPGNNRTAFVIPAALLVLAAGFVTYRFVIANNASKAAQVKTYKPPPPTPEEIYLSKMKVIKGAFYGSEGNKGSQHDMAFDGNPNTFFDSVAPSGGFTGIITSPVRVYAIRYFPRAGYETRMYGGAFEAATNPTGYGATVLYEINDIPAPGWHLIKINDSNKYNFLEYVGPNNGYCDIADVQFLTKKK